MGSPSLSILAEPLKVGCVVHRTRWRPRSGPASGRKPIAQADPRRCWRRADSQKRRRELCGTACKCVRFYSTVKPVPLPPCPALPPLPTWEPCGSQVGRCELKTRVAMGAMTRLR
jgi:hypothetical protein